MVHNRQQVINYPALPNLTLFPHHFFLSLCLFFFPPLLIGYLRGEWIEDYTYCQVKNGG